VEGCGSVRGAVIVILTGVLSAGACGETQQPSSSGEPPKSEARRTSSCKRASKKLLDAIETGLQVDGRGNLRHGYVVRSKDFAKVYMVAADIQAAGLEGPDEVGVWATNSPQAEGVIYAVDGIAKEFSDWGDASKTDAAIDISADGVNEAKRCAETAR
jgi:hypothetical protein